MNLKEKSQESTKTKRSKKTIMKKLKREVKGITLIALVVTIIVLLILAGVALNLTIGQNGIFSRAGDAANTWRNAEANEQLALGEGADLIDQYLNGNGNNQGTGDESNLGKITGNETENTVTQDKYGNPITIPAGFKVVNPNDDVTKGIIIEDVSAPGKTSDTKGSQFVWIPVGDVYKSKDHTEENKETIILGRYTFDETTGEEHLVQSADNWDDNTYETTIDYHFMELASSKYGNATAKNLEAFINKATTSHGYYIGRYEAGDATATDTERIESSSDENPIVCKSGVYPYNYVTQPQASSLARGMYTSSNFDSDLINSYAWDTAIVFIQTFSGDYNYSMQIGVNTEISLQKCGDSILKLVNSGDKAQDVRCNIYDMAGNNLEWSTETSTYSNCVIYIPCNYRGGGYNETYYTSFRDYYTTTDSDVGYSFRPTLYL